MLLCAFLVMWPAVADAQQPVSTAPTSTVRQIDFEGLQRIEPSTAQSYLYVRPGDPFEPDRVDRSLKSLFATGLFADVKIRQEGDRLVVSVIENPIINRVAFEGNDAIDDEVLNSEVNLRPRVIYTRSKVQSDVQRLLTLYRRSGRFAASVEPKVIQLPQNRVDVVFEIDEGDVTNVEAVRFIGNKQFSDSTLRDVVRTQEARWWRILSSDDTYDPDRLGLDQELLRRFYLSEGYADFEVTSAIAELTPDREKFFITITVEEGEQYEIGDVAINVTLPGLEADPLMSALTFESGDVYNVEEVENSVDVLENAVGDRGFAFVDIRPRLQRQSDERKIDIKFEIGEGPRVFVERINIKGNFRTRDEVIRREFRLVEGDAYSASDLRRSEQRIRDLDFFEFVKVEEQPGSAPDKAVVNVDVQEKSTGSLSFGAGFSTGSGALGEVSISERNLLGKGQDLKVSLFLGQLQQQGNISFTEPYFLDREIAAGFDLFIVRIDRQSESSFDTNSAGGALRANYALSENWRQGWRLNLRERELTEVDSDASLTVQAAEGDDFVTELSHFLNYDVRDSRVSPTEGFFSRWSTDIGMIDGAVGYLRNRINGGYYYPFFEEVTGSLTGSAGTVHGIGGDVRLLERFFIGGEEIRGFETDGIGPRDTDTEDALGAEFYYAGSAQVTFPLGLPKELGLRGRAFSDFGSAFDIEGARAPVDDESSIRLSVGLGVTWVSPFGPVGVDFGIPLLKEEFDREENLRINFGTRF
jgi:outer membrane protein insertion porin family